MLVEAVRAPVADGGSRDALAVCTGLVVAGLIGVRFVRSLWPEVLVALPAVAALALATLFVGHLGRVLSPDDSRTAVPSFEWSRETVARGGRLLLVTAVYLLPALVAVVGAAFVLLGGGGGGLLTMVPTVALLVTVAALYVLPAALAATVAEGVRAGLKRSSLAGLASGSYFFAWTVGVSTIVASWSLLTAARTATLGALAGAVVFAYGHLVAATVLREGLARSRWTPPGE